MKNPRPHIGRRRFLATVPTAVAASVALRGQAPPGAATPQPGGAPARFGKNALEAAEQMAGQQLTEAEEDAALGGAGRNLESYETLRKLDIPLDTEPAITFRPVRAKSANRLRADGPQTAKRLTTTKPAR